MKIKILEKLAVILIIIGLVGAVADAALPNSASVNANVFDDILNFFKSDLPGETPREIPLYQPVVDYEEAVIRAVEAAEPSVVSVIVTKDLPKISQCLYEPFAELGFEIYVPCEQGIERREIGGGSGFVVSSDGLIVTNKHVVSDADAEYTVFTNDGERHEAKVLARDPLMDLAVLKIDQPASNLRAVTLGNSDSIKLGQTAIAIGNALGEFRNTVSIGVISGLARTVAASSRTVGTEILHGVIQTDTAINPGNSGGPLLNLKGEVIGINTAVASDAENIGFAIPINQAKRAIESVKATGTIKVPYLGVRYTMTNEGAVLGDTTDGPAIVVDSPAAKAGLKARDVIQEVNGQKLNRENSLGFVLQKYGIGEIISLKIKRGEEIFELKATLEERPDF